MPPAPQITVIIVSRNRAQELCNAIRSVLAQPVDFELIVIDDGSTDDTPTVVTTQFPQIKFIRFEQTQGHIVHRNAGVFSAKAPIALIMDDDALLAPDTLQQTLADFGHPRVAAVAPPFTEHGQSNRQPPAPDAQHIWVRSHFIGAIHALRKDVFVKLGGYRSTLRHFGEELDLCTRFLAAGYVVRAGNASPGQHNFSLNRDSTYERYYATRNMIFFAWHNVPMPKAIGMIFALGARELIRGLRHRSWPMLRGVAAGFGMCLKTWNQRRPPDRKTYALFQELKRRKMLPLEEIESRLPPLA
jgi:glycosyltransferase involved in cell wall biosynthesis